MAVSCLCFRYIALYSIKMYFMLILDTYQQLPTMGRVGRAKVTRAFWPQMQGLRLAGLIREVVNRAWSG